MHRKQTLKSATGMNIVDRRNRPTIYPIGMPSMPKLNEHTLGNGAIVHTLVDGIQPVVRIDIALPAGSVHASKALLSRVTSIMIAEGVPGMTSTEIAEKVDFYGAQMWQRSTTDWTIISMIMLDKHAVNVLPIIEKMVKEPTFPERELGIYLDKDLVDFRIKQNKPNHRAGVEFIKRFYAEGSRYGRVATEEDYRKITREDLVEFHKKAYGPQGTHIFVSGRPTEKTLELIGDIFGGEWGKEAKVAESQKMEIREWEKRIVEIDMADQKQACIHMGTVLPSYKHEDAINIGFVNLLLGGYFGSRLMQNIREKKGLTYGIGSSATMRKDMGILRITSSVNSDKWEEVINEIDKEMLRLHTELVDEEELEMLKSYQSGLIQSHFDGTMASIDTYIPDVLYGLGAGYDKYVFEAINKLTPEDIMCVSQKYLKPENFKIVVVK